jgi:hypothetical protein
VAEAMLARRWVARVKGSRALLVTDAGRAGLRAGLGVET